MTETSHDAPDPSSTAGLEPSAVHDWDPRAPHVLADQIAAYDELRERCPVAHSEYLGWSVLRHDDVLTVLHDHETFSNAVSTRLTVPNGMDPPEHTAFRRLNDKYFTPERDLPGERLRGAAPAPAKDLTPRLTCRGRPPRRAPRAGRR